MGRGRSGRWPRWCATRAWQSGRCQLPGRLEAEGIIRPCDPGIVAARIKRADRRPKGWDLDLAQVRSDLTGTEAAVLERQFPGLTARTAGPATPMTA